MMFQRLLGLILSSIYVQVLKSKKKEGQELKNQKIESFEIKSILVVRTDLIGDFVMTTPLLRGLSQHYPDAQMDLVVHPQNLSLAEACPYIHHAFGYDATCNGRFTIQSAPWKCEPFVQAHLRERRYDLAIAPRFDMDLHHATAIVYLSNAKYRLGWSEKVLHEKAYFNHGFNQLLTHVQKKSSAKHELERNLELLENLGIQVQEKCPELWVTEEDERCVKEILHDSGMKGRKLVAICLGATDVFRIWPLERFIDVAKWLGHDKGYGLVLIGGSEDHPLANAFMEKAARHTLNQVGRSTLRESLAFMKQCEFYLGNDTGPAHMASAVGVPVVVLSCHPEKASSKSKHAPERIAPWIEPKEIVRPTSGTSHPSIEAIQVVQVKDAVESLLKKKSGR